jgi:predicted esterase
VAYSAKKNINCRWVYLLFTLTLWWPSTAQGQQERLELGRRVKRFEIAWQQADDNKRAAIVRPVSQAVQSFFSLDLRTAAEQLDQAWEIVRGSTDSAGLATYCKSLASAVEPLLAEDGERPLMIKLESLYTNTSPLPEGAVIELVITNWSGESVCSRQAAFADLLAGLTWENLNLGEGDYNLELTARTEADKFVFPRMMFTRIRDSSQRLMQLEAARSDKANTLSPTARASIRDLVSLAGAISKGLVQETDFPIYQRLQLCERLAEGMQIKQVLADATWRSCDLWLTLGQDRKSIPVRLRLPPQQSGPASPAPVLFLFHGMGGSENMFFETYGAGRAVDLASQRGWIVVAPRQALLGISMDVDQMLKSLEEFVDVDRTRVMLMGHSMGAAQVVSQATLKPDVAVACVALGGGRRVPNAESLSRLKWFVAAGVQDFGRTGAKQLHASLEKAGASSVYRDYPDVEHLVIVQAALDNVFEFLDQVLVALPD